MTIDRLGHCSCFVEVELSQNITRGKFCIVSVFHEKFLFALLTQKLLVKRCIQRFAEHR